MHNLAYPDFSTVLKAVGVSLHRVHCLALGHTKKISGFWFLRVDKIDPHARIIIFKGQRSHHCLACRLGMGGSILNLRCFPNSKTADSFTERYALKPAGICWFPHRTNDGLAYKFWRQNEGDPWAHRTTYDRLIDFQQRRLGVALIQLEVADDSSPGSDLDRTSAMMETRLHNINHLTSSSNRCSQEILLLKQRIYTTNYKTFSVYWSMLCEGQADILNTHAPEAKKKTPKRKKMTRTETRNQIFSLCGLMDGQCVFICFCLWLCNSPETPYYQEEPECIGAESNEAHSSCFAF